jgi:hypothetical protein
LGSRCKPLFSLLIQNVHCTFLKQITWNMISGFLHRATIEEFLPTTSGIGMMEKFALARTDCPWGRSGRDAQEGIINSDHRWGWRWHEIFWAQRRGRTGGEMLYYYVCMCRCARLSSTCPILLSTWPFIAQGPSSYLVT